MSINNSRIIQGCMTWGIWGKNFSIQEIAESIEENVDLGVTTFDHADIYGDYTTEAEFGKALLQSKISRDKIQLISKCGIQLINESRKTHVKHYNYDASYIIAQAERSLKHLQTDYLDLFLLHRPSPLMQISEIVEAITQLKKEGKIKDFGVSNFTPQQINFLKNEIDVSANQIQCSLTHYQPLEDDSLFYHQQHNIITMAWSPLGGAHRLEVHSELKKALKVQSEKYECTESQLVLAWLLKHPAKIYPVLGTSKTKRIEEALGALKIELSLQDWFILYEASRGTEVD
jgi:predicted oxidoreductase